MNFEKLSGKTLLVETQSEKKFNFIEKQQQIVFFHF